MPGVVTDAISWWAHEIPDQLAVSVEGEALSYRELEAWSDSFAHELTSSGVGRGDRVGVVGDNCLEWVVAAVAIIKVRALPFFINARFVAEEVAHLIDDTAASAIVTGPRHAAIINEALAIRVTSDVAVVPFSRVREVATEHKPFPRVEVDVDDPLALVYTSGSTGRPRGAILTHRSHSAMVFEWSIMGRGYRRGMKWLCVLPLAGLPSFVWGFLITMYQGGTAYILRTPDPARMLRTIEEERITVCSGVPTPYERAAMEPGFEAADLSSLEHAQTGGARVSQDLLERWQKKGVRIQQTYGMTEAGGSFTITPYSRAVAKAHTCGPGGIFSKYKIIRPDGSTCDVDEPGEILIFTRARAVGYWGFSGPNRGLDLTEDGWLRTGDIGRRDADGDLVFIDRAKELIISGGLNISPLEIENVLVEVDNVEEAAVISIPDQKFGEVPGAVLYGRKPISRQLVIDVCRKRLASYKLPRYVIVSGEPLPRLGGGKLSKNEVRRRYRGLLGDSEPTS